MSRIQQLVLSTGARTFAQRLLSRHPDWEPFLTQYQRVHTGDTTALDSLWLEVPSPSDPAALLWAIVQEREVLVGLGHRGAEALFVWEPAEQDAVIDEVLNFIDDVTTAEVVATRERHRFLWRTWESAYQFRRAADVIEDPKVVRILAWPTNVDRHRATAT